MLQGEKQGKGRKGRKGRKWRESDRKGRKMGESYRKGIKRRGREGKEGLVTTRLKAINKSVHGAKLKLDIVLIINRPGVAGAVL